MMNKLIITLSAVMMVSVPLIAQSASSMEQAQAACSAADSARDAAAKAKMEWRDTGKMIKSAKKKIEAGEYDAALTLCEKAKFQGEAGVKQAAMEADNWMMRVVK